MEDPEPSNLILLFLIISFFLSGFFSGSEVALLSITEAKVRSLKKEKKRGSKSLSWLKKHPDKLIITILIGNNLVNILASVLTTVYVRTKFGDESAVLGLATGILTIIVLIFGEIIPKTFAQHYRDKVSLISAPLLYFLAHLLLPIVWLLEKLTKSLKKESINVISEEELEGELLALAEIGEEGGALDKEEREFIENVLEFSETTVKEVMTPRPQIDAIEEDLTIDKAVDFAITHSHSRLPIYADSIDKIVGIITIRDLLFFRNKYNKDKPLSELEQRKVFVMPHTRKTSDALKDFQRQKIHLAIVVDEHGSTVGLVTLEDLMEEIFGEIEDESDFTEVLIKKVSKNSWKANGSTTIEECEEETGIKLDEDDSKTISLLILEELGRFPRAGEKIEFDKADIFVEKIEENKIESVRVVSK